MDPNGAEDASDITRGPSVCNRNVIPDRGPVIRGSRKTRKRCSQKNCTSKNPSAHKNLIKNRS
jgi:hypothetical protein